MRQYTLTLIKRMNSVAVREAAFALASCQVPAAKSGNAGGGVAPEVIRVAKGRFPADLNRLRGQLSLEASVGEPVVLALECGSSIILIAACDDKNFYGTWDATHAVWAPTKAEDLYGSAFSALVQSQVNGESKQADVWVASFLAFPAQALLTQQPAESTVATPETPTPVAAPTAQTTKKKTVVRKRPLATPVVAASSEEDTNKKAAVEPEAELDL